MAAQLLYDLGSAAIVSIRIVSMKEKAQCVFWFHEMKLPVTVQRNFRREYERHLPDVKNIRGCRAMALVHALKILPVLHCILV
jgi:hypothetical protein